jgi:hypothetical protein
MCSTHWRSQVHPRCFFITDATNNQLGTACNSEISDSDIRSITSADASLLEKYDRFKFSKENKNARYSLPFFAIESVVTGHTASVLSATNCALEIRHILK